MKFRYILLCSLFLIFLAGIVSAQGTICIDFDTPNNPTNLQISVSGNDVQLTWNEAIDEPECSGISSYNIYRDGVKISNAIELSFEDSGLNDGTYVYGVSAVDKANHESDVTEKSFKIDSGGDTTTGGSSNGGSGGGGNSRSSGYCGDGICSFSELEFCSADCGTGNNNILPTGNGNQNSEFDIETLGFSEDDGIESLGITGAITGFAKSEVGMVSLFFVLLIIAGVGIVVFLRRGSLTK